MLERDGNNDSDRDSDKDSDRDWDMGPLQEAEEIDAVRALDGGDRPALTDSDALTRQTGPDGLGRSHSALVKARRA